MLYIIYRCSGTENTLLNVLTVWPYVTQCESYYLLVKENSNYRFQTIPVKIIHPVILVKNFNIISMFSQHILKTASTLLCFQPSSDYLLHTSKHIILLQPLLGSFLLYSSSNCIDSFVYRLFVWTTFTFYYFLRLQL